MNKYIPESVTREILKVLEHGEVKHGESWKTKSALHHMRCAHGHMAESWGPCGTSPFERESESGLHHLAHAIVRLMFALALVQDE